MSMTTTAKCVLIVICLPAASSLAGDANADLNRLTAKFYPMIGTLDAAKAGERAELAKQIKSASETVPADWNKRLLDRYKSLRTKYEGQWQSAGVAALTAQVLPELDTRRKTAVDFIASDAYNKETQPKVDEMVKKVEEVWNAPYAQVLARVEPVRNQLTALRELEGYLALYPDPANPQPLDEAPLREAFNKAARGLWISKEWQAILDYNAALTWLDDQERKHLVRLNEYRIMMGRAPLEADIRLELAARGHSQDMKEKGFFSHESPVPGKKSFGDRAALAGYHKAGGENIFAGSTDGLGAFDAWYHSPGHHKNMMGGYRQIGAGRFQDIWTQLFGGDGPFATKPGGKPPAVQFAERLLALSKDATVAQRMDLAQFAVQSKLWDEALAQVDAVLSVEPKNATAQRVKAFCEAELAKTKKRK
jgi:uncharacterized protein YkwD